MNTPTLTWLIVMAFLAGGVVAGTWMLLRQPGNKSVKPLPTEWALALRGVFNPEERRAYRILRDALPHHAILPKLPLVRLCQPLNPSSVGYWYELLGATHVSFAICTPHGRVLAAIDLEGERNPSRRSVQMKQEVLAACKVQYLRCPIGKLPTAAELQLLVPRVAGGRLTPQPDPLPDDRNLDEARDSLAQTVASRRAERSAMWQDSSMFQDSFFMIDDVRLPDGAAAGTAAGGAPGDIVGIVTDHPRAGTEQSRQDQAA